jgi:hypothetical protein
VFVEETALRNVSRISAVFVDVNFVRVLSGQRFLTVTCTSFLRLGFDSLVDRFSFFLLFLIFIFFFWEKFFFASFRFAAGFVFTFDFCRTLVLVITLKEIKENN